MSTRILRVKADGRLTMNVVQQIVTAFSDLLDAITRTRAADDAPIEWILESAQAGSIDLQSRGVAASDAGLAFLDDIVDDFQELSRSANNNVTDNLAPSVLEAVRRLAQVSVFTGKPVLLGVGKEDIDLLPVSPYIAEEDDVEAEPLPIFLRSKTRTAIRGQIVTCDDKQGIYFTLMIAGTNRLVRCWPEEKDRELIAKYWGQGAWVIVEGTLNRYSAKPTMTNITDIVPLEEATLGSWREAVGISPRPAGATATAAEVIRRFRDGEI